MTIPPTAAERAAIARRIANWMPQNVEDPDPAAVATTRALVAAADPQSLAQAGQVLPHTYKFVVWAAASGVDVGAIEGAAGIEALERYETDARGLAGVGAGSRRAVRSYLRRILAGQGGLVSEAATKRRPAAPVAGPKRCDESEALGLNVGSATDEREPVGADPHLGTLDVSCWPELKPAVAEMLSRYLPRRLDRSLAERVAPLARAAAAASGPGSLEAARRTARACFYLAAWVDAAHRPLRSDVVFAEATMTEFLTVVGERLGPATAGTYRSGLRNVARSVIPGTRNPALPRFRRTRARPPACDTEVARVFAWAKGRRSPSTKRHATAMVLLAVAAGLDGSDSPWVRPEHLVELANGVGIEVHKPDDGGKTTFERVALVLPDYAEAVRAAFSEASRHSDLWLLGGGANRRTRSTTLRSVNGRFTAGVDLTGLRNRWLVELVEGRQLSLFDVMRTAGITTLRPLEDLLGFVADQPSELGRLEEAS